MPESEDNAVNQNPGICPQCGSTNPTIEGVAFFPSEVDVSFCCTICDKPWTEIYTFSQKITDIN